MGKISEVGVEVDGGVGVEEGMKAGCVFLESGEGDEGDDKAVGAW